MAASAVEARAGFRVLTRAPGYLRLWGVGGLSNGMRQFEILAAGLFTFQVTHSALAVAVVSACRNLPMLLLGAFAGVVSESRDRRAILIAAQAVSAGASLTVAGLAAAGLARPWVLALAALASGVMWSTEGATRRRMLGEAVAPGLVARAYAFDSLTNSLVRMAGPVGAGVAFATLGLGGAFAVSGACYLVALVLALGVPAGAPPVARPSAVATELAEGFRYARSHAVVAGSLAITFVTNMFAFSYIALVAPVAERSFGVAPALVGVLAAGEPVGALLAGTYLARFGPPLRERTVMVGGAALFLAAVAVMPRMPAFWLACLVMVPGGFGSAGFSAMQTTLIARHTPPAVRSRVLGLLTVCIGAGPVGFLLLGGLGQAFGDRTALQLVAWVGLALVGAIGWWWRRREGG